MSDWNEAHQAGFSVREAADAAWAKKAKADEAKAKENGLTLSTLKTAPTSPMPGYVPLNDPDQQKNGGGPDDKAEPKAPCPKDEDDGEGSPPPDDPDLPRGFYREEMRKDGPQAGIYYQDGGEPQFVCGPLNILGRVRDPEGQSWARLIQWHDPDGVEHIAPVSDAKLHGDMPSLCGELATQGLKISTSPPSRALFVRMLSNTHPDKRITIVGRTGWHNLKGADVFVLPEQVIGAGDVILAKSVSHAYQQQGSLEEWKSAIASKAVGNTRLIFAISMALTPPLLSPCGWESGGFHLRHQSSTGKTTTFRIAASAFGGPPNIRSWRATSNGLEGVAAAHCDSLLVLDELSQVSPREAGQIAYMLANGSGKTRANREGGARAVAQWRLLFLSSGEIALAEKVAEDGRGRATAGQQIRIVDVPSNLHSRTT
jgi:putative DNA primase/helicase